MRENRFLYLVKFIACMLVIVIHTRFPGNFGIAMDAISRIAVPFFFALSGRFLLREGDDTTPKIREKSGKYFIKILKITGIVYIVYFVYSLLIHIYLGDSVRDWLVSKYSMKEALWFLLFNSGTFVYDSVFVFDHMWFLFALLYSIGLIYIFAGVLRKWYKALIALLLSGLYFGEALQTFYPVRAFGISITTWYIMRNWLFVGLPFVLLGILLSDIFREKREKYREAYTEEMTKHRSKFILMIIGGASMSVIEAFAFGKKEVYIGSLLAVIGIFLLSECRVFAGNYLYKIGKKSSNEIYYYHVLVIAVINRLSYSEVIPYPPMWIMFFLTAGISIILIYFVPLLFKKEISK
ncbi:MAG: acyltransferase family protein [Butyrivibrio sp.]|nr:acyltransferase family protein [Butyrivibrio sp.]